MACDLLKDLMDSGYRAYLGIYNSIIGGLCNVKHVYKAYKLFEVTVQDGIEPDFATLNPMLVCYAEMGKMDDFCKLLEQMKKLKFSVVDDLEKFFEFVVGKEERIMMALEVFEEIKGKGFSSVGIYNILMGALHKIGDVQKALSLYGEMNDLNLELDSSTYNIAIQCFVETEDIQEACACHNEIIVMYHVPTVAAYCSLAKGLCKIGEIDSAMISGDAEKVIEVINEMMQEGCHPDEVICSTIISGMCKNGTLEEARKVFTNLRERQLLWEASTIVYDEIFIEHMKKTIADLVLSGLKVFWSGIQVESKGLYTATALKFYSQMLRAKGCMLLSGGSEKPVQISFAEESVGCKNPQASKWSGGDDDDFGGGGGGLICVDAG
ncbi:hypothetical protein LWI29_020297 [Acer saccharum]|uniref:Pentatricopeptide repeat-containing protein n=1 Tax=Acer saccharum TaxID=4024 RepID=A0AA39VCA9_ACESA|nr:hypothetical protein LWI29_020297 [Acer saccharum]